MKFYEDHVYIEMCRKAGDVQKLWKPQNADIVRGDFVGYIAEADSTECSYALERFSHDKEIDGKYAWYARQELIWLPRQDQLQDLIQGVFQNGATRLLIKKFDAFLEKFITTDSIYWSMEKLWLAFVMRGRFNKAWNGEDWI